MTVIFEVLDRNEFRSMFRLADGSYDVIRCRELSSRAKGHLDSMENAKVAKQLVDSMDQQIRDTDMDLTQIRAATARAMDALTEQRKSME